jgi:cytochrome c-type biogenesis protein CcmH
MIWLAIALLAALAMAPAAYGAWRGAQIRGRRDAAMALHRAQLTELDRDLAEGRLLESEHAGARLEVQRRLLGDAALTEAATRRSSPVLLVTICALAPAAALLLYVAEGHPDYAAQQKAAAEEAAGAEKDAAVIAQLRAILATMDPKSQQAHEGFLILGRAELARGHLAEAAEAWRQALADKYEPQLAAETAEIMTEAEGHTSPEALALFKKALADAPPDAPWRSMAQKRITEAGG